MKSFEKLAIAIGVLIVITAIVVIRVTLAKRPTTPVAPTTVVEPGKEPEPTKMNGKTTLVTPAKPVVVQPSKEKKEGAVLAEVNGVPITEYDVFGPAGLAALGDQMPVDREHLKRMLDQAIEQELLRQYAVRRGLDQSADYKQAKGQQEGRRNRMEIDALAARYEQVNEALKSLRESLQATDAEVEQYYQQTKERYGRLDEETAKRSIQTILSTQKYNQAYKEWLLAEMTGVSVLVNGQAVPQDAIRTGLDTMFPSMSEHPMAAPPASHALEDFVRSATGATDSSDAARQKLMEAEIQIGSNTVKFGEFFGASIYGPMPRGEMVQGAPVESILRGPMLIATIKNYVLAEKAKQAGLDKSAATPGREAPMYGPPVSPEMISQQILTNMVWQDRGLDSPEKVEVTDAEITQHIDSNPARYERIRQGEGGEERAKMIAQRTISYEKLRQQKETFVQELKAQATIEILDERFK